VVRQRRCAKEVIQSFSFSMKRCPSVVPEGDYFITMDFSRSPNVFHVGFSFFIVYLIWELFF